MNKTKKLHLAIGDLTDVEAQDANGETTGNFADTNTSRALGVAIWNVQHGEWGQAVVAFEQDGHVYEVYVTPIYSKDINGIDVCFEVKLEYRTNPFSGGGTLHTENISYDTAMTVSLNTALFETLAS